MNSTRNKKEIWNMPDRKLDYYNKGLSIETRQNLFYHLNTASVKQWWNAFWRGKVITDLFMPVDLRMKTSDRYGMMYILKKSAKWIISGKWIIGRICFRIRLILTSRQRNTLSWWKSEMKKNCAKYLVVHLKNISLKFYKTTLSMSGNKMISI